MKVTIKAARGTGRAAHPGRTRCRYEIYLNDPAATPKADLRTEMYILLAAS